MTRRDDHPRFANLRDGGNLEPRWTAVKIAVFIAFLVAAVAAVSVAAFTAASFIDAMAALDCVNC